MLSKFFSSLKPDVSHVYSATATRIALVFKPSVIRAVVHAAIAYQTLLKSALVKHMLGFSFYIVAM